MDLVLIRSVPKKKVSGTKRQTMRPSSRKCRSMEALNDGRPFVVVRMPDGALGVVDESRNAVWYGYELTSRPLARNVSRSDVVVLPGVPAHYGQWTVKSIGGVSDTVRLQDIHVVSKSATDAVIVFATHCPSPAPLCDALSADVVTIGEWEHSEEYGYAVEMVVHDGNDVGRVCALIARHDGQPVLEDAVVHSHRPLGIERLDRIDSEVVSHDTNTEGEGEDAYGVRRGRENWRFSWMPPHWRRVPITWDHMVDNVIDEDIGCLSQPLRQHVARRRIAQAMHERVGTRWVPAEAPPSQRELAPDASQHPSVRTILTHDRLASRLASGDEVVSVQELEAWGLDHITHTRFLVQTPDGRWFRPRDTSAHLTRHIPARRFVSAALTQPQSSQLLTMFYLLNVERVSDPDVYAVACLVSFRYMVERGYTARRMGKYVQQARHIGNGNRFRPFKRLLQYDPERLPVDVLNKLCTRDGRLRNRGSKGTRSKYRTKNRYLPKMRLTRTREQEAEMRGEA
jgi:hypothetical protein